MTNIIPFFGENLIHLLPAKKMDSDLLYKWVNDEIVRKNSFNSAKINYEDHIKWFEQKLKSDNSLIFIAYEGEIAVGQIRIDIENNIGLISYSIAKEFRGKGFGTKILALIIKQIKTYKPSVKQLIGKVKINNLASQKSFEKANFSRELKSDYFLFVKQI